MNTEIPSKAYLGDSVYVEFENSMIKLTTNNGEEDRHTIYLEKPVWDSLKSWVTKLEESFK